MHATLSVFLNVMQIQPLNECPSLFFSQDDYKCLKNKLFFKQKYNDK